jgi:hypothetical protein
LSEDRITQNQDEARPLKGREFDTIADLLKRFQFALDEEIAAVRERPSQETLEGGVYAAGKSADEHDYTFKSGTSSLRFAEQIRAKYADKGYEVSYVDAKDDEITLRFPEHLGLQIPVVDLEWENDFVLRKMQDQIRFMQTSEKDEQFIRIRELFYPDPPERIEPGRTDYARRLYEMGEVEFRDDGLRNEAQQEAIRKALYNRVSFVWGPPGTGKTSTLGYIVANFVLRGKRTLFVSNTNRAVDVGMLAVMEALHAVGASDQISEITRFGDIALESEALERIHHQRQADARRARIRQLAAKWQDLLARYGALNDEIEAIEMDGSFAPEELEIQMDALSSEIRKAGGLRRITELLENLQPQLQNAEYYELISKKAVGTTLARVCTSDMLFDMEFDAVVVDESSMASLPYLAVMASRCTSNLVIAGDPMQLPPIAVTKNPDAAGVLEQDIFGFASRAEQVSELFDWHDFNPLQTTFFDIQYRLRQDLADIISEVFYEGRLKTADAGNDQQTPKSGAGAPKGKGDGLAAKGESNPARSFEVVDTSFFEPLITKKNQDFGFSPINEMHQKVLVDLVYQLVTKDLVPPGQVGVIVPFRSAVWDIRKSLRRKGLSDIEVGTIHTFQGREKRIIVFDTVMSGMVERGQTRHFSVRPFDETKNGLSVPRLLNVAFSRAKDRLIILADMNHINKVYNGKFLGRLLARLQK